MLGDQITEVKKNLIKLYLIIKNYNLQCLKTIFLLFSNLKFKSKKRDAKFLREFTLLLTEATINLI
tara:strand:+ start:567 stop:764 length:198 start_codon:yes stop_codon:yes gene_type:complete